MPHRIVFVAISCALIAGCAGKQVRSGMENGRLRPCPDAPKCVSTQEENEKRRVEPIPYEGGLEEARHRIVDIIEGMKRSKIITREDDYIYAQFKSGIWGFIDDVEFYFDDEEKVIHFRSSARFGYYDWNVNRKRMESIRQAFVSGG
jgi:uncharacterized protein (DUF1499 family)